MKLVCISTVSGKSIAEAANQLKIDGLNFDLRIIYPNEIDEERIGEKELARELGNADVILIDIRGDGKSGELIYRILSGKGKTVVTLLGSPKLRSLTKLGSFSMENFPKKEEISEAMRNPETMWKRIERIQKLIELAGKVLPIKKFKDARNYVALLKYWNNAGKENYYNMFLLLGQYFSLKGPKPKEPVEHGEYGIYHPHYGYFNNLHDYINVASFNRSKPTIGLLFYGGMHFEQVIPTIKVLMGELKECNFIPVYVSGVYTLKAIGEHFFLKDKPIVDCVISLLWFRLNGGPFGGDPQATLELLKRLNVPVFTPAPMFMREIKKWEESETGLSPIEYICAVIWPELDGCIEPIPSCGLVDMEVSNIKCKEVGPIGNRIERTVSRVQNWIKLKNKPNIEKRVAFIVYGYPPGETNIGSAAYLDTFQSVERLLRELKEKGYNVQLPEKPLHELFQEFHIVNSGKWLDKNRIAEKCFKVERESWRNLFEELPESSKREVVETWGESPGNIMVTKNEILIPGIELGNVFIGLQPARPPLSHEDVGKAAHDKTKPPHHQYVAFYDWLENMWRADVVIHVGTHGLAEFMKGKEVGMSEKCFPDILIGNMPHLYIYHVLNTSESTIAKRRLYGTMVDYNSPPYTTSDLYEEYVNVEELIHEYNEARVTHPVRANKVRVKLLEKANELNLDGEDIDKIQDELYEMKRRIIPKGLHILGERYSEKDLEDFLKFILRYDRGEIKSLNRILTESKGIDYDNMMLDKKERAKVLGNIDEQVEKIVKCCLDGSVDKAIKLAGLKGKYRKKLAETLNFGVSIVKKYVDNSLEIGNLLRGLNFEFIEPALGGDVVRSPEVLPTGRNLNQFDPNRVPTEAATERGKEIAENTLKYQFEKDGKYPESVGIVLWGFETTKTQGETIGQILYNLGVKIVRRYGSWYPELEVIPLEELGRPRIDCLLNICGFFREMFPNIMQLLDRAFNLVAGLDESEDTNFIRKHSQKNYEELKEEIRKAKIDERTAWKIANGRIFGPAPSEYGTRMLPLVEDSIWEKEEELAEVHIQSMNYLHADNIHAMKADKIYRKNLSYVDLVSQVRDSHDYEIVDLDHYYEFFGGLARSVETVKGKKPEMLISDTTKEVIETEFVGKVIDRGMRTRILNPKWIDEMLKHDFHGAQKIADRVEYALGLAATTNAVDNWIWSGVASRYVFDEEMRKRLMKNNRWATHEIVNRLFEANKRGYWQATEEEIEKLKEAYLEIEGWIEERIGGV